VAFRDQKCATWRFAINDKEIEIDYIPRSLEEYISVLERDFSVEYLAAISAFGDLVNISRAAAIRNNDECFWIIARKRATANLVTLGGRK
jgi:hypothetical protein